MTIIPIETFEDKLLKCSDTNLLLHKFPGTVWIDDDFMNDANIPFDYDGFLKIDDGIRYLNPEHFSVIELIKFMSSSN